MAANLHDFFKKQSAKTKNLYGSSGAKKIKITCLTKPKRFFLIMLIANEKILEACFR
jgi:hypothetical protein